MSINENTSSQTLNVDAPVLSRIINSTEQIAENRNVPRYTSWRRPSSPETTNGAYSGVNTLRRGRPLRRRAAKAANCPVCAWPARVTQGYGGRTFTAGLALRVES